MKEKINLSILNLHLINYVKENNNAAMLNYIHLINSVISDEETETKQKDLFELVELLKMTFENFDYNKYMFNKSLPFVLEIEKESSIIVSDEIKKENNKGGDNGQKRKADSDNNYEEVNNTIKNIQVSNYQDAINDAKDAFDYYKENNVKNLNGETYKSTIYFMDLNKTISIHNVFTEELTQPYDVLSAFNYINFCCESKILNNEDMEKISNDFNIEKLDIKTEKLEDTETIIDILKVNYNIVKFENNYIVVC